MSLDKSNDRINNLRSYFEAVDTAILQSEERVSSGWVVKDKRTRRIITEFGYVRFVRTRYYNKFKKQYRYLADDYLQIEKYKRLSLSLKVKILNCFGDGDGIRYKDIVHSFRDAQITTQTVSNIVRHTKITDSQVDNAFFKSKKDISNDTPFHIETDDTFFTLLVNRKKVKYRLRLFVVHNGMFSIKGRHILKNRTFFYILKRVNTTIKTESCIAEIKKHIKYYYDIVLSDIENVYVHGDGASWIQHLASSMGRSYILDKFHLLKEIKHTFTYASAAKYRTMYSKERYAIYQSVRDTILTADWDSILLLLKNLVTFSKQNNDPNLSRVNSLCRYVKNHKKGIQNLQLVGSESHTEAQISHLVKSTFSYGRKIYSLASITNILRIKQLKVNGFDFEDILLTDYWEKYNNQMLTNWWVTGYKSLTQVNADIRRHNVKAARTQYTYKRKSKH